MTPHSSARRVATCLVLTLAVAPTHALHAQQAATLDAGLRVARLVAEPAFLELQAGEAVPFRVTALDAEGRPVNAQLRVTARRSGDGAVRIAGDSVVGLSAGENQIVATVVLPAGAAVEPPRLTVPVTVSWPSVDRVVVESGAARLYVGTTVRHRATALHADGSERPRPNVQWASSDPTVATVDRFGDVAAVRPGTVTITASVERSAGTVTREIAAFPATTLDVRVSADAVRTGDVVRLEARALDRSGRAILDVPVVWSFQFTPDDSIRAPGASGLIRGDRFVGEVPGIYTVLAHAGPLVGRHAIDVRPREAVREVVHVGHGGVQHVRTSDLWVYEGVDGRDYAITGTWGADGYAYFWDVTDPSQIVKTDSLRLDARTVNDVKVAPNGRYAALSREGASNRRNGLVVLDLQDPAHPRIAATYDDGLTGGVHNMFATDTHLFALSAGDKYVILDMGDLAAPRFVSEYDHPDSRVHDVWVHDGLAYSSEWGTGIVVVDVGNGRWGGTIEKPVFVTAVPYPVGATHAAFPYAQQSTGKFYLFLGDEIMSRRGAAWAGTPGAGEKGGTPEVASGYIHVIDFTDPMNPRDVARYEVREFGTHNLWIEDDVLFQAYYDGGLRMVDVSGELLGNLAEQGREIAVFKSFDPGGFVANAAFVWGAQPYKGHIFFSDHYSGLWAVRLQPGRRPTS